MKKLLIVSLALSTTLVSACTNKENMESKKDNQELKSNVVELNESIKSYGEQIESFKIEKENFPIVSNLSREFVQAHTSGDKEKMKGLVSNDISIVEKKDNLYAVVDNAEWLLFSADKQIQYQDWVIQGYYYNKEDESMNIYIREFFTNTKGELVSPPTFLNLTFKQLNGEWKIINISFDV